MIKYSILEDGLKQEIRILNDGSKFYLFDGKLHRTYGPAIEYYDGAKAYFCHGKLHRLGFPAVISSDGKKEYWVDGQQVKMKISSDRKVIDAYRLYDYATSLVALTEIFSDEVVNACIEKLQIGDEPGSKLLAECLTNPI
jgi:hypothetical protein